MADNDCLIEQMRLGREKASACFIEFSQLKKYYNTHVFCFYEGKTDGEYYNFRIKINLDNEDIITIVCGDKDSVIKLKKMIDNNTQYNYVSKMFFIDRDFDKPQPNSNDLYETDCYSIENYYVGKEVFENILQTCFLINKYSNDYSQCIKLYDECFKEFHDLIFEYNVLLKYKRIKALNDSSRCENFFKNLNHILKIDLKGVRKTKEYDSEMNNIYTILQPDKDKLLDIKKDFSSKNMFQTFNGKAELFCFKRFLSSLREEYNNNKKNNSKFFSENKLHIELDPLCNTLGSLSQFAYTPPDLIEFIKAHRLNTSSVDNSNLN